MPYIKQVDRVKFQNLVESMDLADIKTPGELNYLLTNLVHAYLGRELQNYQSYNDAMGALEGCKLELYRKFIASYEDSKIIENGDVPT